jgi:DNA-binding CsgD family transcriptional regulator
MPVLERESHLRKLHGALVEVAASRGRTVLVTGEAGIGKTSVVEQFSREAASQARVLWGACEALFAPRPLGPFYDVVHALGGPLLARLESDAKPIDLFRGLVEAIRKHEQPSIVILEVLHWADHGTLDFVRFLARRIDKTQGMLLMTFRDDEVGADHPLTAVLGELPAMSRVRVSLPPLSRATVETLARQSGHAHDDLFRITGGNPFFVTELLHQETGTLSPTIKEAMLARARRLTSPARELLDLVAVVPDHVELTGLRQAMESALAPLEECIDRGLLGLDAGRVFFRHELARLAIEAAIPPLKRAALNEKIMLTLVARGEADSASLARIAHHAIAAGDIEAMCRYAPRAAAAASASGAHREASVLLAAVLPHVHRMPVRERAQFYEQRAQACILVVAQGPEAVKMSEAAFALWEALPDEPAKARNIVRRCEFIAWNRPAEPMAMAGLARQAIDLLEPLTTGDSLQATSLRADLALAYCELAIALGSHDRAGATKARDAALAVLARVTAVEARTKILMRVTMGDYQYLGTPTRDHVAQLTRDAHAARDDHGIVSAYCRAGWMHLRNRELDALERAVTEGRAFAIERQLERTSSAQILVRLEAELTALRGRLAEAEDRFRRFGQNPGTPWQVRLCYSAAKALMISARRGEPIDATMLDEAFARLTELYKMDVYDLHRADAEIQWTVGNVARARNSVIVMHDIAAEWKHPWALGDAWLWSRLIGADLEVRPAEVAPPYALQMAGDACGAAEAWAALGLPYESALALSSGDTDEQREAIRQLETIGARGAANRLRERMREDGVRGIPLGPRATTKSNAAGLTERELEVLAFLADGLSNPQIAERLHRSVRTIEHHVAAVIEKLGAGTRQAAVARARSRGLLTGD